MLTILNADTHTIFAAGYFQKSVFDVTKEEREIAKRELHKLAYSGGYIQYRTCRKKDPEWHLDTHSTILSRSTSYHYRKGKFSYVKTKKISYPSRRLNPILRFLHRLRSYLPRWCRFILPLGKLSLKQTTTRIRDAAKEGVLEYQN